MSTSNPNQYGGFTKKQYLANLKKTLAQIRGSSGKIVTNEQKLVGNDPTTVKPASIPSGPNTTSVPSYVPPAYVSWVQGAAESTGLPANVVAAQINDESGFDPTVTSPPPAGAEGIAQFEPKTWKEYGVGPSSNAYNPTDAQAAYINLMNSLLVQYNGNVRDALAAYNAGSANIAAGYGYADNILAAAGVRRTITDTNPGPQYGGSRPGGGPAGPPTPTPGSSVDDVLNNYVALRDMPRTAPPGTKNPFSWWKASFTGDWDTFRGGGGTDNG